MTLRPRTRSTRVANTESPLPTPMTSIPKPSRRATKRWNNERGSTFSATVTIVRPFAHTHAPARSQLPECPRARTTGPSTLAATSSPKPSKVMLSASGAPRREPSMSSSA